MRRGEPWFGVKLVESHDGVCSAQVAQRTTVQGLGGLAETVVGRGERLDM